ncbi:type II toxin-antitoxin system RelE/ParE family toxin [Microbacterium sp. SZ1]|uniref:type II toxin-antitoxin system RelE/ParE family toxin n=1 Tax=Microbacterium sp. SZ1 TaxID=1849736 RepID=UPI00211C8160|nr:type II toxin-antitoxin system RelE/ParE family toxin [Microbacterium sp. SZ1]
MRDLIRHERARTQLRSLIVELQELSGRIAQFPSIGSPRFAVETGIEELRDLALRRFPYVVFYGEDSDVMRILRVRHHSHDIPAELRGG